MRSAADLPWTDWIVHQPWYAGQTRQLQTVTPNTVVALHDDLDLALIDVAYTDGSLDHYQVLVSWGIDSDSTLAATTAIGADDEGHTGYAALSDPEACRVLLSLVDESAVRGDVTFSREPDAALPLRSDPQLTDIEQSNTSVLFGQDAILKIYRRVTDGTNPDIELNGILSRAGNPHVARLLGSYRLSVPGGDTYPLGLLSVYAANATDGLDMATASARNHLTDFDGAVHDDGSWDFSAEAFRMGEAVAAVHATLADQLSTVQAAVPVDAMIGRMHSTAEAVPKLQPHVHALEQRFRALSGKSITLQRMHGDLHLGQMLRTPQAWLVIDFEGEPGQPADIRRAADSPFRDIGGMLRSFEYVARGCIADETGDERLAARSREWVDQNCAAFCDGYAAASGINPQKSPALLVAYQLDKAIYEAAYEARQRPEWLPTAIESILRLLDA